MIDIHCHILPGVDDGSTGLEESVAMARLAVDSGITAAATTSHFRGARSDFRKIPLFCQRFDLLERTLKSRNIPLKLYHGAEILCVDETPVLAARQMLPTLGEGNYVLVEFFFGESPERMDLLLEGIARQGYQIVVAHPERYDAVQDDLWVLRRWFDRGYALQVNKGSILGHFGSRIQETVWEILHSGLAHAIASDAHRSDFRTPHMTETLQLAQERLGAGYTDILTVQNPARILAGEPLVPVK